MTISNFNNTYFKLSSDVISNIIDNLSNYATIEIDGVKNCCSSVPPTPPLSQIITITDSKWYVDLSTPTGLNQVVTELFLANIYSSLNNNILVTPIDLSYVDTNCAGEGCTLQTYASHFVPLFKTQIDTWFTDNGISSNVTVEFLNNSLLISNLPNGFIIESVGYGVVPYTIIYSTRGSSNVNSFIGSDGIYVSPLFFGNPAMVDGVYSFTMKASETNLSSVSESNCAFIDITTRCTVASTLQSLLDEINNPSLEEPARNLFILHYALINGSNCGCNCDELCEAYQALTTIINDINPNYKSNCGC